jgi:hypothetical protein
MPYEKPNEKQKSLFGQDEPWEEEWQGMPEYNQKYLLPAYSVKVNFTCVEDLQAFSELIKQRLTIKTTYVWFPEQEHEMVYMKRYVDES